MRAFLASDSFGAWAALCLVVSWILAAGISRCECLYADYESTPYGLCVKHELEARERARVKDLPYKHRSLK